MLEPATLKLDGVTKIFSARHGLRARSETIAVDAVSLEVAPQESFGLVGESGSGKTTLGRMIVNLAKPTAGSIEYAGAPISGLRGADLHRYQRSVQMVFQNTSGSLNARRRIGSILRDPLEIHTVVPRSSIPSELEMLVGLVGLPTSILRRYPHELSSGQRQRVGIARALSLRPQLVVADEPVSALDASVAAQVLNLLRDLTADLGVSFIFISHDLRAVTFMSDRIGVMYGGQLMEVGTREAVITRPAHPYTAGLLASAPGAMGDAALTHLKGELGGAATPGCRFAPRCSLRTSLGSPAVCEEERPALEGVGPGQAAACHFAQDALTAAAARGMNAATTVSPIGEKR
jgi:peptide/nickel transport system ATP-binding protein